MFHEATTDSLTSAIKYGTGRCSDELVAFDSSSFERETSTLCLCNQVVLTNSAPKDMRERERLLMFLTCGKDGDKSVSYP